MRVGKVSGMFRARVDAVRYTARARVYGRPRVDVTDASDAHGGGGARRHPLDKQNTQILAALPGVDLVAKRLLGTFWYQLLSPTPRRRRYG